VPATRWRAYISLANVYLPSMKSMKIQAAVVLFEELDDVRSAQIEMDVSGAQWKRLGRSASASARLHPGFRLTGLANDCGDRREYRIPRTGHPGDCNTRRRRANARAPGFWAACAVRRRLARWRRTASEFAGLVCRLVDLGMFGDVIRGAPERERGDMQGRVSRVLFRGLTRLGCACRGSWGSRSCGSRQSRCL